jgi:hypothetical protein
MSSGTVRRALKRYAIGGHEAKASRGAPIGLAAVFLCVHAPRLSEELRDRLAREKWKLEWPGVVRNLDNLNETNVAIDGKSFALRGQPPGVAGKVSQACGAALPAVLRSS